MACGSCGGASSQVAYRVTLRDGTVTVYASAHEASAAIRSAGGGTMKPVPKPK